MSREDGRLGVGTLVLQIATEKALEVRARAHHMYCLVDPETYDEKNGAEGMEFVAEHELTDRRKYQVMKLGGQAEAHPQLYLL